ncbi:MAG: 50S ribosomal protein L3 N(5)-glutamine methyltransferase [Pseudomonadales bacterium]|jgi:ribosomal protein L3 glutamine methyltransferase|tara:strand:- start:9420 stop:10322 length:903 start_codon:yes stop_codon:yes gene_type:complete
MTQATAITVGQLIEQIHQRFTDASLSYGHGTDNAWDEAVYLVLWMTDCDDDESSLSLSVSPEQVNEIFALSAQRIERRVPLAYLLGCCQFMGYEFLLEPGVVVPRSPIGYLIDAAEQLWLPKQVRRILDLCSGSGCLGIVAAHRFPDAQVTLLELDPTAASLARENVLLHALEDRVTVIEGDATQLFADLEPGWDLIITNPPYVDKADMQVLPPEYLHEPTRGLAGGDDGLLLVDEFLRVLPDQLAADGAFVCEVGASSGAVNRKHSELPIVWLDLPHGGEGVFLLEGEALCSHTTGRKN